MQFLVLYKTLLALPYSSPAFYTKLETPTIFGHHFFLFIFPFPFSFSISCSFYCLYCLLHFFLFPFYSHKKLVQVQKREKKKKKKKKKKVLELDQVTGGQAPSAQGALQSSALSGSAPSFPQDQGRRCVERCFAVCGHLGSGFCGV